jgi:WD40 repeat protein
MKKTAPFFIFWILVLVAAGVTAQETGRPVITLRNATQVELLGIVGWYNELKEFDTSTQRIDPLKDPLWPLWTIAFNADGTLFAIGNDNNEVVLFDVLDEPPFLAMKVVLQGHQGPVYALAFHPDGQHLASGSSDGMIYIWDVETGEVTQTIETNPKSAVYGLAYSPSGEELRCGMFRGEGIVRTYSEETWCSSLNNPGDAVYSIAFSPNGSLVASGDTLITSLGDFSLFTPLKLETRRTWSDSYRSSRSKLTFSADGSVLLNGGTHQYAYVWHMDSLAIGRVLQGYGLLTLSPDGSLIAGRNLVLVNAVSGETLHSLEAPDLNFPSDAYFENLPRDAVFNPDGTIIVTANIDGTLKFWGIPN